MRVSFEQLLGDVTSQYVLEEVERHQSQPLLPKEVTLSAVDKNRLSHKILLLPHRQQSILFFRYCLGCGPQETESTLGIDQVRGRLAVTRQWLSAAVGVPVGMVADDVSMHLACRLALPRYIRGIVAEIAAVPTPTSNSKPALSLMKRLTRAVAVAAAIVVLTFSTALVANAELRQQVIGWLVETFPQFSVFWPDAVPSETTTSPHDLVVGYLPNGFALVDTLSDDMIVALSYDNEEGAAIDIVLASPSFVFHADTENAQLHKLMINDSQAYWWEKEGALSIVWQQSGVQCDLRAFVSLEEALKIAENVVLKKD